MITQPLLLSFSAQPQSPIHLPVVLGLPLNKLLAHPSYSQSLLLGESKLISDSPLSEGLSLAQRLVDTWTL